MIILCLANLLFLSYLKIHTDQKLKEMSQETSNEKKILLLLHPLSTAVR